MGLLSNLALLTTAVSAVVAAPATPKITSISFSGNGCAKAPKFSGDFNAPTITLSDFAASSPDGNRTVNCQVHLQAQGASPGWQVALKSNVAKGHIILSPGTSLTHYTTVFFSQDASNTKTIQNTIENTGTTTINQGVTIVNNADTGKVWSPCTDANGYTGIMNINFRGALTGDGKAYFETTTEEWELEWRQC
ncbi:hypothetical protein VTI28DRAFT_7046 [Corynascus sepedonium]